MFGKVKRREVYVQGNYYNFDERFEDAMDWIDNSIQVLSITPISRNKEEYTALYEVIYRDID